MQSDAGVAVDSPEDDVVTLPASELRASLECILTAVEATAHASTTEHRALEEQRQRVFSLLRKLDSRESSPQPHRSIEPHRSGDLLSPSTDTQASSPALATSASSETIAWATDVNTHATTPGSRCLLGNLFTLPRPTPTDSPSPQQLAPTSFLTALVSVPHSVRLARKSAVPRLTSSTRLSDKLYDTYVDTHDSNDVEDSGEHGAMWPESRTLNSGWRDTAHVPRVPVRSRVARLPSSFWINVWPCYGGTAASLTRNPTRLLVHDKLHYFEDVLEKAAQLTSCRPPSHRLYAPDGRPVCGLDELVAEQHYLLFPAGGFYRRQAVPTSLLWLLYTDARHIVRCT